MASLCAYLTLLSQDSPVVEVSDSFRVTMDARVLGSGPDSAAYVNLSGTPDQLRAVAERILKGLALHLEQPKPESGRRPNTRIED